MSNPTSYITKEELRKLPFRILESEMDDAYADYLIAMTTEFINTVCKQDFFKEGGVGSEVEKRVSGTDQLIVFMPKRLIKLKEVRIYYSDTSFATYTDTNFLVHPRYVQWLSLVSAPTPRLQVDSFQRGVANIGIIGIWGYEVIPNMIKYLQGRMIKKIVKEASMTTKNASESVGDYSASPLLLTSIVTGDSELDLIIKRHTDVVVHVPT